jgi:hypothetical protein
MFGFKMKLGLGNKVLLPEYGSIVAPLDSVLENKAVRVIM